MKTDLNNRMPSRFTPNGFLAAIAALALAVPALAETHERDKEIKMDDQSFVQMSGQGHMVAREYGQLAMTQGESEEVREFGKELVADHSEAQTRVQGLARDLETTLPAQLLEMYQERIEELKRLRGAEFDREITKDLVTGHRIHLAMYQKARGHLEKEAVKEYVEESLTKLREHLAKAQETARAIGVEEAAIAGLGRAETEKVGAPALPVDSEEIKADDSTFVKRSAQDQLTGYHYAHLAIRKGEAGEVRDFGEKLVSNYREAQDGIYSAARELDILLPVVLSEKYEKRLRELEQLSGSEFDREFAKDMVKGHRIAVAFYEQAEEGLEQEKVREYAEDYLAKLEEHLEAAQELAQSVGIEEATIAELGREEAEAVGAPPNR